MIASARDAVTAYFFVGISMPQISLGSILFELSVVDRSRGVQQIKDLQRQIEITEATFTKFGLRVEQVGYEMQKFAKDLVLQWSLAAGVVVAVFENVAIQFDAKMREVQRTSQLSRAEIDQLGQSFVEMSKSLPTKDAAMRLAEIAVVAGQVGLKSKADIERFSFAVNKLSTVFEDLDPKETAERMAQIAFAFGLPIDKTEQFGSVISEIANASVATAGQLVVFTQAVAGAGKSVGIALPDLVALGGEIINLGVPANVAGTALANFFTRLATEPEVLARRVGISTTEFKNRIRDDAIGAVMDWLRALQKLDQFSAATAIEELGIRGYKATNVLQKLRQEGIEPLTKMMHTANQEWAEGTSLGRQFDVIASSVQSDMNRMTNEARALAITVGTNVFPVVRAVFDGVKNLVQAFASMPAPIQSAILLFGALVAAAGPLSLMFANSIVLIGKFIVAIQSAVEAMALMRSASLFSGEFGGLAGIKTFIGLIGPANAILISVAVALAGAAAAMALFSSKADDTAKKTLEMNNEIREHIKSRVRESEAVIAAANTIERLAAVKDRTTEQQTELNGAITQYNQLLPGTIIDTNNLAGSLDAVRSHASDAQDRITGLNNALIELSKSEKMIALGALYKELPVTRQSLADMITENWATLATALIKNEDIRKALGNIDEKLVTSGGLIRSQWLMVAGAIQDMPLERVEAFRATMSETADELYKAGKIDELIKANEIVAQLDKVIQKAQEYAQLQDELNQPAFVGPPVPRRLPSTKAPEIDLEKQITGQLAVLQLREEQFNIGMRQAEKEGSLLEYLKEQQGTIDDITSKREALLQQIDKEAQKIRGVTDLTHINWSMVDPNDVKEIVKLIGYYKQISTILDSIKSPPKEAGKSFPWLAAATDILRFKQNEYEVDLKAATLAGQKDQFLAQNETRLKSILVLHDEIVNNLNEEIGLLTGGETAETLTIDKLREFAQVLTSEDFKRLMELLSDLKNLGRGEKNIQANTAWQDLGKTFQDAANWSKVAADTIQNAWSRTADALAESIINMKLTFDGVFKSILQNFLAMIIKMGSAKLILSLIPGLGAAAAAVGDFSSSPQDGFRRYNDFMVRRDGAITSFSPDDTVIGFKNIEGLLSTILPSLVSPQFATVPNYNITVPSPNVHVDNKPPEVSLYIRSDLDAIRFLEENEPRYQHKKDYRRLVQSPR